MNRILILGAGVYQVPLIKKANELGIFSIVVSTPGNHPGFKFADKVIHVDTTDYKGVLEVAKAECVDGICTAGTDVAIVSLGYVCEELGLCGISYDAACIVNDKARMKDAFFRNSVRTAKYYKTNTLDECKKAYKKLDKPVVVKATDSSGSRGITVVKSEDELEDAFEIALSVSRKKTVVVEEYIEGEEFGAQAFVENGEIKLIIPHGDYVFKGDTGVPIGHYAPYDLPKSSINDLELQLEKAIKSAGLNTCAINADFILKDGELYVLEIGARSGATCLAELTGIYYGIDYYAQILKAALGQKTDFRCRCQIPNASMLIFSDKSGVVKAINNFCDLCDERIVEVQIDCDVGDEVREFKVGPDRLGHVITKGNTLDEALKVLENVLDSIKIEVE